MARLKLSEDLRPLSDLETQMSEVVQQAHTTGWPVRSELQRAVDEAEQDLAEGNWVENSEVVVKLKRWSAGEP
jgi:hypothetical protein